jgi:hypothetical protein
MDDATIRVRLMDELRTARESSRLASEAFDAGTSGLPTGIPYPDSTASIHQLARENTVARQDVMIAVRRLNDYVMHGVVPEDLK